MLENIKSHYTIKIIFSIIDEKIKLGLVKYNKRLQNKIEIRLLNYKLFSKRYIIYETNGKGKEYFYNDKLIFEGEYKIGLKNGDGKEFFLMVN